MVLRGNMGKMLLLILYVLLVRKYRKLLNEKRRSIYVRPPL
nr:MAG TPA: hypothetical protein [Caudoviricetes sp.]